MKWLGFIFLLGCAAEDELMYEPELYAIWTITPEIEICDHLNVRVGRIIRTLDWWSSEISDVYQYGNVYYSDCEGYVEDGVIRFDVADKKMLRENDWVAYAIGKEDYYSYYPYIRLSATVYILPGNSMWTIRHEIGHAWGWNHTPDDQTGHLMHYYGGKVIDGLDEYSRENALDYTGG